MYIPLMLAMLKPEFIQHSCYKFMFLLGVIDMIVLPFDSIIGGIQILNGAHFCTNPNIYYITGFVATGITHFIP
jgi:hypothetical protein